MQRFGLPARRSPDKDFEIALTVPVLATNNAVQTIGDTGTPTERADVHVNPDIFLKWSHQFETFRLSTSVDASADRFLSETEEDEDTLFGGAKFSFTDGRSDLFVPYLAYAVTADLRPTFGASDDVLHDFSAGVSSGIGLSAGGSFIRWRDAVNPGESAIVFDLSAGRRLADPRDFENTFAIALLDYTYVANASWELGFTPKVRVRWYNDFDGGFRRDERLSAALRAAWTPAWLTQVVRAAELDFTVSFRKNYSTLVRERFSEWEGGPAMALAWRF